MTEPTDELVERLRRHAHAMMFHDCLEARPIGYCDNPCNGPIIARSRVHLFVSWLCYRAVLALPNWSILDPLMFAMLPRAGDIAFACTCRDKIAAAIAKAGEA